jgi:hypothetical protein
VSVYIAEHVKGISCIKFEIRSHDVLSERTLPALFSTSRRPAIPQSRLQSHNHFSYHDRLHVAERTVPGPLLSQKARNMTIML